MRLQILTGGTFGRNTITGALAWLAGIGALGCQGPEEFHHHSQATTLVRCQVTREECGVLGSNNGGWQCLGGVGADGQRTVKGDVCVLPTDPGLANTTALCEQKFCTNDVNAPGSCRVSAAPVIDVGSPECVTQSTALVQLKDVVVHSVHPDFLNPIGGPSGIYPGLAVNATLGTANDPPICVPPHAQPLTWVRADVADVSVGVSIGQAIPNSPACTSPSQQVTFSLAAGSMGTATSGTTTVPLNVLRAHAKVGKSCFDEICVLKTLDSFNADLADMTVAGVQLRKLRVNLAAPAPLTTIHPPDSPAFLGVAPGALRFRVDGQMNGVDTQVTAVTTVPFRVDAATNFRLLGNLDVAAPGPNGTIVTVRIALNANGAVATPQQAACTTQSGFDRLFGFEDPQLWSTAQAQVSLVTSPVTQGCGALGVRGSGFIPIVGAPFSTVGLATNNALSVDLFIPGGQPNPFYLGALQMHLSCPSGGVSNQYIGQVELTGKPLNQYSTLRFSLPQAVRSTLARQLNDCSLALSLNVNQTGNTWMLDRLRFTP